GSSLGNGLGAVRPFVLLSQVISDPAASVSNFLYRLAATTPALPRVTARRASVRGLFAPRPRARGVPGVYAPFACTITSDLSLGSATSHASEANRTRTFAPPGLRVVR